MPTRTSCQLASHRPRAPPLLLPPPPGPPGISQRPQACVPGAPSPALSRTPGPSGGGQVGSPAGWAESQATSVRGLRPPNSPWRTFREPPRSSATHTSTWPGTVGSRLTVLQLRSGESLGSSSHGWDHTASPSARTSPVGSHPGPIPTHLPRLPGCSLEISLPASPALGVGQPRASSQWASRKGGVFGPYPPSAPALSPEGAQPLGGALPAREAPEHGSHHVPKATFWASGHRVSPGAVSPGSESPGPPILPPGERPTPGSVPGSHVSGRFARAFTMRMGSDGAHADARATFLVP